MTLQEIKQLYAKNKEARDKASDPKRKKYLQGQMDYYKQMYNDFKMLGA